MKKLWLSCGLVALIGLLTACNGKDKNAEGTDTVTNSAPAASVGETNPPAIRATETPGAPGSTNATASETKEDKDEVAVIKTNMGEMAVKLWPDVAPKTVANFKKLVRDGFYNGTAFHRIIKGFMIQGGDPLTKDPSKEADYGTGGPGYTIDAEFNDRPHELGVISMARGGDPNSAGSQFFICLDRQPKLDHLYTAFGKLIKGEDVLKKIGDVPVTDSPGGGDPVPSKPVSRVHVESIRLVPADSIK